MGARRPRLDEAERQALVDQLSLSWRGRDARGAAPSICEGTDRQGRVMHVSVVWEAWVGVEAEERAEIIVEALRVARGPAVVSGVTAVIGMIPAEAGRLSK